MSAAGQSPEPSLRLVEWQDFSSHLEQHRLAVGRMLRLGLAHDARRQDGFGGGDYVEDLCQRAVEWVLEHATEQPAEAPLSLWLRKVALTLLDEDLEREALSNGGLYHSRTGTTTGLMADVVLRDPRELQLWLNVADRAEAESRGEPVRRASGGLGARRRLVTLEQCLLRLPELRRRAVSHYYFDHLAANEIAFLLDVTVAEVERELSAGRKGLWLEIAGQA